MIRAKIVKNRITKERLFSSITVEYNTSNIRKMILTANKNLTNLSLFQKFFNKNGIEKTKTNTRLIVINSDN